MRVGMITPNRAIFPKNEKSKNYNKISFEGQTRDLTITVFEEYKPFKKGEEPPREIMHGRSRFIEERLLSRHYEAYCTGPVQVDENKERALYRAIVSSKEFPMGGKIQKTKDIFVCAVPYGFPETTKGSVYFTDKFEKVYRETRKNNNYVVYDIGAYDSKYYNAKEDLGGEVSPLESIKDKIL